MQPQRGDMRTSVLTVPSDTKISRTVALRATSSAVVGTWNTHTSTKKNPLKENSVLKEVTRLAMVDSFITGTSLSSDLNTPEIRIDGFAFNGKTVKGHGNVNMAKNSFPEEVKQTDPIDGSVIMDCLPLETESLFDPYTLLDMSPGVDTLQAEQLEERINFHEFAVMHDETATACVSSSESTLTSHSSTWSQPQNSSDNLCVNIMGTHASSEADFIPEIAPGSSPPQLSITDEDFNLNIPHHLLEDIENMFPDLPSDLAPCSTDLDMYIGTRDDLLFGAMEQSGMLDYDLNAVTSEVTSTDLPVADRLVAEQPVADLSVADHPIADLPVADESPVMLSSNMFIHAVSDAQPVISMPGSTESTSKDPLTFVNKVEYQPTLETPTTSFALHPQRPSKKRHSIDTVTPVGVKRQRRSARKPLRFRDSDFDELLLQDESCDVQDKQAGATIILKEEPEIYETSSLPGRTQNSSPCLTEEQKYHRIRILNNEASKRCRQKRKDNVKQLEIDLEELEERNEKLKKMHDALLKLKNKMQPFVYKVIAQGLASNQGIKN